MLSPSTTLAILLGASTWPKASRFEASEAFAHSANKIRKYFTRTLGLGRDNFLDLFDADENPDALDYKIGEFLSERCTAMKEAGQPATDLLLYYIGHGGFAPPNDAYCLAIGATRDSNLATSSISVSTLALTLKNKARSLRRIIVLDCCFAGSASEAFQAGDPESVAERQLIEVFQEEGHAKNLPQRGTSLLCASSPHLPARRAPDGQGTMFSEALSHVLSTGDPRGPGALSLRALKEKVWDILQERYPDGAPRPEVHSPDQREGDVAGIPLFPNLALSRDEAKRSPRFEPLEGMVQCYVVLSETEERSPSCEPLGSVVHRMLLKYKTEIERETRKQLQGIPFVIHASQVLRSRAEYESAIVALCRADIAVFDVTGGYEPAIMLLLGIRSVVRRGVTICSAGGEYVIGEAIEYPFSIREVNILSHSDRQIEREDPIDLMGRKVTTGLQQLSQIPNYLDLPVFEAVRSLPPDLSQRAPKEYTEQVLVLCSFKPDYQRNNWTRHLRRNLPVYIRNSAGTDKEPAIVRTLDLKSPRLVSQSLYEAIRLTSMCVIDWTGWPANVFFELGVRLAVSEIGTVCIIEEREEPADDPRLNGSVTQRKDLLRLFQPIRYRAPAPSEGKVADEKAFEKMVAFYRSFALRGAEGNTAQNDLLPPDFTYQAVTRAIDWGVEVSANPVYNELIESANLLDNPDIDSSGQSPVLYPGNANVVQKAEEGALERRLAAWYYIDQRYSAAEIQGDQNLSKKYEELGNILARALLSSPRSGDKDLARAIRNKVRELKATRRREGDG